MEERILHFDTKHNYEIIKRGRKVLMNHPAAGTRDIYFTGDLDNEHTMDAFKASLNGMINVHNGGQNDS